MLKRFRKYIENRQKGPEVKKEYLNAQGNLVEKPKEKLVADYDGPDDKKPPKNGKEEPSPYRPATADAKGQKGESGFGDEGDKKLVYEPDTKGGDSKQTALGKELGGDWPKAPKTEGFLAKTRKMNANEFRDFMLGEHRCNCTNLPKVTAYETGAFHPHPSEAIRYVTALVNQNDKMTENFVHEIRRSGDLGRLLRAMLEHAETYSALVKLFEGEEGAARAKQFTRAMNEAVGPPLGIGDENEEEGQPELDDEGNPIEPPPEEEQPELDDEGNPVEQPPEEEPELDDEGNPVEQPPDEDMGGDPLDSDNPPPPAMKKKKAHDNIFGSMKNFENLKHVFKRQK